MTLIALGSWVSLNEELYSLKMEFILAEKFGFQFDLYSYILYLLVGE